MMSNFFLKEINVQIFYQKKLKAPKTVKEKKGRMSFKEGSRRVKSFKTRINRPGFKSPELAKCYHKRAKYWQVNKETIKAR